MRRLVFLAKARADLIGIFESQAGRTGRPDQAVKLIEGIDAKCRQIARTKIMLGRPRPKLMPDIRSFLFGQYLIFLRYRPDEIEIVTILHGRRDIETLFREMDEQG